MKLSRIALYGTIAIPVALVAIYFWNPFSAHTLDPRGRVLGVIPYRIPSSSMEPALKQGGFLLACTTAYRDSPPKVGDIIVFWSPQELDRPWVKRVTALAGDSVEFQDGKFLRNGAIQEESFTSSPNIPANIDRIKVPAGYVYVLGDNRSNSFDSRFHGPILISSVIGKVCAK